MVLISGLDTVVLIAGQTAWQTTVPRQMLGRAAALRDIVVGAGAVFASLSVGPLVSYGTAAFQLPPSSSSAWLIVISAVALAILCMPLVVARNSQLESMVSVGA